MNKGSFGNIKVTLHEASAASTNGAPKITSRDCSVFYGDKQALINVNIDICDKAVTAFIGPSGCGKSTFLRCLNRMNDFIDIARVTGSVEMDGVNIYDPSIDPVLLRARVGMVFQKPNPFPKSIYDNVAYGPRGLAAAGGDASIVALRQHFDEVRRQVLAETGGNAEAATRLLVNKLLHTPSAALRALAAEGNREGAAEEFLCRLFGLAPPGPDRKEDKS